MRRKILLVISCAFLFANSLSAFEKGDFLVRVRALDVYPLDSSGTISTIPGARVAVKQGWTGELDFTYMLTSHWGVEQILAISKHKLRARGSIKSLGTIGSTWVLPPTLLLQYHFFSGCKFQPYLGVGVNYSLFWSERTSSSLPNTKINLKHSWGLAGQVGFDYMISHCWFFNADLKYIDIDTKAKLKGDTAGKVRVGVDPLVFGMGFGRRF